MFDDIRLRADVLAAILWEPGVAGDDISVTACLGRVTLLGHVSSYAREPEPGNPDTGDEIVDALYRSWFLNPDDILVDAEAGTIRLPGEVHPLDDSRTAPLGAWSAPGVTALQNIIGVP